MKPRVWTTWSARLPRSAPSCCGRGHTLRRPSGHALRRHSGQSPRSHSGRAGDRDGGAGVPRMRPQLPRPSGDSRLLPRHLDAEILRTVDTFGWEWQSSMRSTQTSPRIARSSWTGSTRSSPSSSRTRWCWDAGCGMGRFAAASGEFGACDVLAVDLSSAVEVAYRHTRSLPNVHVIQADIYHLPFARAFDFAFSIGVLHHLPDPEGGFRALVRHLKPQGSIFAWVYGREPTDGSSTSSTRYEKDCSPACRISCCTSSLFLSPRPLIQPSNYSTVQPVAQGG